MTTTHGLTHSKTHNTWVNIRQRCHNPNVNHYERYGGRGITVCERWRDSFEAFLEDMGECPDGLEIDRIDNLSGYSPENCRWTTRKINNRNRRSTRIVVIDGVEMSMAEASEITGIKYGTIKSRLRLGLDPLTGKRG